MDKMTELIRRGITGNMFKSLDTESRREIEKSIQQMSLGFSGKERAGHKYHRRAWDTQKNKWIYFYKDEHGNEKGVTKQEAKSQGLPEPKHADVPWSQRRHITSDVPAPKQERERARQNAESDKRHLKFAQEYMLPKAKKIFKNSNVSIQGRDLLIETKDGKGKAFIAAENNSGRASLNVNGWQHSEHSNYTADSAINKVATGWKRFVDPDFDKKQEEKDKAEKLEREEREKNKWYAKMPKNEWVDAGEWEKAAGITSEDWDKARERNEVDEYSIFPEYIREYMDQASKSGEATHVYKIYRDGVKFYDIDADPYFTGTIAIRK